MSVYCVAKHGIPAGTGNWDRICTASRLQYCLISWKVAAVMCIEWFRPRNMSLSIL
jgi:hypothetical protein